MVNVYVPSSEEPTEHDFAFRSKAKWYIMITGAHLKYYAAVFQRCAFESHWTVFMIM